MRQASLLTVVIAALVLLVDPADALVGEAAPADVVIQRHTMLVYSPKGRCSGVVLAQDLVLTAAHCVEADGISYSVGGMVGRERFMQGGIAAMVLHPGFRRGRTSSEADLAVVKLAKPLPALFAPVFLRRRPAQAGDRVIVSGYGSGAGQDRRIILRSAALVVSSGSSQGQMVLADANRGAGSKLGSCGGDSGGPVFSYLGLIALVGIMVTGNCGGGTGMIAISQYYDWIAATADRLGSSLK